MRALGDNLPGFRARQLEFAAHIRDPESAPAPADVEPHRMRVYVELFFNTVEGLLANAFPVARRVLGEPRWRTLVRQFLQKHPSASPYFLEISQEFLQFINDLGDESLPGFMLELCHYEWVELALGVAEEPDPPLVVDPLGDLRTGYIVMSPLAWPLSYAYPVHRIGPGHRPEGPGEQPTHLVVYRQHERIHFMEVNALTQRLLLMLDGTVTGQEALARLAGELPELARKVIDEPGLETLGRLRSAGIIAGVVPPLTVAGSDPVRLSSRAGARHDGEGADAPSGMEGSHP